jgi:hypothetical protein
MPGSVSLSELGNMQDEVIEPALSLPKEVSRKKTRTPPGPLFNKEGEAAQLYKAFRKR